MQHVSKRLDYHLYTTVISDQELNMALINSPANKHVQNITSESQICLHVDIDAFHALMSLKRFQLSAHLSGRGVNHR